MQNVYKTKEGDDKGTLMVASGPLGREDKEGGGRPANQGLGPGS